MYKTLYQRFNFKVSEGQVVSLVTSTVTNRAALVTEFAPKVSFTVNGDDFSFVEPTRSMPSPYKPGDKVKVIFNPAQPTDARVYAWWSLYLLPSALIIIGGGTVVLMVGMLMGKISSQD